MTDTITIGRRLIPLEQIALVEPFDPAANARLQSDRPYKARVVLVDRESVLTEMEPLEFAEKHAFRMVSEDNVATNPGPSVHFSVESFEKADGFNPTKPYRSRLKWRDLDGNTQSKLMLTQPEVLLAITVRGEAIRPLSNETPALELAPLQRRSRRRRLTARPQPA